MSDPLQSSVESLRRELKSYGLDRVSEKVVADALPSIAVVSTTPLNQAGRGLSRLGGDPDLPRGVKWPTFKRRRMIFIAQFNLVDFPADVDWRVPKRGLLSFFVAPSWRPFETAMGAGAVFAFDGEDLVPARAAESAPFPPFGVSLTPRLTLPDPRSDGAFINSWQLSKSEWSHYLDLHGAQDEFLGSRGPHQLMGHFTRGQNDVLVLIQGEREGYSGFKARRKLMESPAEYSAFLGRARSLKTLGQFGEDACVGTAWGDSSYISFVSTGATSGHEVGEVWLSHESN